MNFSGKPANEWVNQDCDHTGRNPNSFSFRIFLQHLKIPKTDEVIPVSNPDIIRKHPVVLVIKKL